jgi:hypothetical protein
MDYFRRILGYRKTTVINRKQPVVAPCQQRPIIQYKGSCWAYAIFNMLLLSDDGIKILFIGQQDFLRKLPTNKQLLLLKPIKSLSTGNKSCDIDSSFQLYRFFNSYLCLSSLSTPIMKNKNLSHVENRVATFVAMEGLKRSGVKAEPLSPGNETFGLSGGFSERTVCRTLHSLGFNNDDPSNPSYYIGVRGQGAGNFGKPNGCKGADVNKRNLWKKFPLMIIDFYRSSASTNGTNVANLPHWYDGYTLTGGVIVVHSDNKNQNHAYHTICGFMCNGVPHVVDSNYINSQPVKCRWWIQSELAIALRAISKFYGGAYDFKFHSLSLSLYTNTERLSTVAPYCSLPRTLLQPQPVRKIVQPVRKPLRKPVRRGQVVKKISTRM